MPRVRSEARAASVVQEIHEELAEAATKDAAAAVEAWAHSGPTMGAGYERIAKKLYSIDEVGEYEHLEKALTLDGPAHRADYATLVDALDQAEDNARRAHALYVNAAIAYDAFEIDARVVEGALREKVLGELQKEKAEGARSKAIVEKDIALESARAYPDEVRDLHARRAKAKRMVEHFERLADLWKARARALEVMVSTMRR